MYIKELLYFSIYTHVFIFIQEIALYGENVIICNMQQYQVHKYTATGTRSHNFLLKDVKMEFSSRNFIICCKPL